MTPDDRRLAVEISGAEQGTPVFLLHGTPGSRRGPKPRGIFLYRMGVRLICYDRPGYGDSDRHEGRGVADAAYDLQTIADELRLDQFAVVGRSGGGPHALACAALLPHRVTRAAALVSLAPADAFELDWHEGMTDLNVDAYRSADEDDAAQTAELANRTRKDPESLVEHLRPSLTVPDLRVVDDIAIRRQLTDSYREATRFGPDGWIDDVRAFRRSWGFALSSITAPVRIWHGDADTFSPVQHARWLAAQIPHAELQVELGAGHFRAVEILGQVLGWLAGARETKMDSGPLSAAWNTEASVSEWERIDQQARKFSFL